MRGAVVTLLLLAPCFSTVASARRPPRADAPAPSRPAPPTPPTVEEPPEQRLARGRQAYLRDDFEGAIRAIRPLLYPEILLRTDDDVIEAHRLLALAYLFARDEKDAEDEFNAILQLRPGFALDPVVDPPAAIHFLDSLKRREAERLRRIEQREAEEARAAEERRRRDEEERIRRTLEPRVVVRTVEKHFYLLNFVPFGAGQLQNGERKKAAVLLATQLALGATSLALWSALEIRYAGGSIPVPVDEVPQANAIRVSSIVAGGLFWADVVYGIVDAIVHYKPEVVRDPAPPQQPPSPAPSPAPPRASLGAFPLASPNGLAGAGLSIQGVF